MGGGEAGSGPAQPWHNRGPLQGEQTAVNWMSSFYFGKALEAGSWKFNSWHFSIFGVHFYFSLA